MSEETAVLIKAEYAKRIGVTSEVIKGWIRRHWVKGEHYNVIGWTTLVNVQAADAWCLTHGTETESAAKPPKRRRSRREAAGTPHKVSARGAA